MKALESLRRRAATDRVAAQLAATAASPDRQLHGMLRQRGIAMRCRSAELAHALQRFRDRQAEIDAGMQTGWIHIPALDTGWMTNVSTASATASRHGSDTGYGMAGSANTHKSSTTRSPSTARLLRMPKSLREILPCACIGQSRPG